MSDTVIEEQKPAPDFTLPAVGSDDVVKNGRVLDKGGLILPLFGPPNIEKLKVKRDIEGLIKALDYRKDYQVRQAAAEALGQTGDARALEPLKASLKVNDINVQKVASRALITVTLRLTDDVALYEHSPISVSVWETAVQALVMITMGVINDTSLDENVRKIAVQTLVAVFLDEPQGLRPAVARSVAQTLVQVGQPAVGPLITALNDLQTRKVGGFFNRFSRDENNEKTIIETLVNIGEPSLDPLIAVLQEKKGGSWHAATILGRIGHPRAVGPLMAVFSDKHWFGRGAAAEALGLIGNPRAVKALIAAPEDTDRYVRNSVVVALQRLRGSHLVAYETAMTVRGEGDRNFKASDAAAWELTQIGDKRVAETAIRSLQRILKHYAAEIEPQMLRQITCLGEVQQLQRMPQSDDIYDFYLPKPVDCSYVKWLAWQELIRRGLEV